jgi:hypothetical protein
VYKNVIFGDDSVGLDLNPIGKPKKGFEEEFRELFNTINDLTGAKRDKGISRWFEIQVSPYETLKTPKIGIDTVATNWVLEQFSKNTDDSETEEEHIKRHYGIYLPRLSPASDGIPVYSNSALGIASIHSFRGQFIVDDCSNIVSPELIESLYSNCMSEDAVALSGQFFGVANRYAIEHKVEHVENLQKVEAEEKSPEMNAHILYSFSKWLRFWGEHGHGFEADY